MELASQYRNRLALQADLLGAAILGVEVDQRTGGVAQKPARGEKSANFRSPPQEDETPVPGGPLHTGGVGDICARNCPGNSR